MSSSAKQFAAAAQRNRDPILDVLKTTFADVFGDYSSLKLLEISSGTGQHSAHFAAALPRVTIQPSEFDLSSLASIAAYGQEAALPNLLPPLHIDISKDPVEWPQGPLSGQPLDVMLCVNMLHITPWSCGEGLFRAAGALVRPGGVLITYGPYAVDGVLTPDSNVNFDSSLRARDSSWGIRDTRTLAAEALNNGLRHTASFNMPANNHTLVFRKL